MYKRVYGRYVLQINIWVDDDFIAKGTCALGLGRI